jgi:hypothetical protein
MKKVTPQQQQKPQPKKEVKDNTKMYQGALEECQLWKSCIDIGLTYPQWRKRHFTKKKDIEDVRKLQQAFEQVESYLQDKLK